MKKSINHFGRMLGAFILCAGLVMISCESEEPISGENTEMDENKNNANENPEPEPEPLATVNIQNITYKTVDVTGKLNVSLEDLPFCQVVVYYSKNDTFNVNAAEKVSVTTFDDNQKYSVTLTDLDYNTKYNYCVYCKSKSDEYFTEVNNFTTLHHPYNYQADLNISSAIDLSSSGSANCYIVTKSDTYKFKPVKGNSTTSVESVASASILWETFGTSIAPEFSDLISAVTYKDGYIAFKTADTYNEGNAVIAAKDASGNILWSWHIWLTDQPKGQAYYNKAGTVMDRNLGATSATSGDPGAIGLLYQWGRKDPFLGSSSIDRYIEAASTITWPSDVSSNSSTGTIEYATANPTTFIYSNSNKDWYYTVSSFPDSTRWTESDKIKSIYDPCPAGWRVPDGGSNGVWSVALGSSLSLDADLLFDSTHEGINFSGKFGSATTIWYPASGVRSGGNDSVLISTLPLSSYWWSASINRRDSNFFYAHTLNVSKKIVAPNGSVFLQRGLSVRCVQE